METHEYWKLSLMDLYQLLGTSSSGLSDGEVEQRLKIYGYNELDKHKFSSLHILFKERTYYLDNT
jgi:magnesium-transporting ATPase (P-type)